MKKNPVGNPNIHKIGFKKKEDCSPEQWAKQEKYWSKKKPRKWSKEVCIQQLEELMDILKSKVDEDNFKELGIIIDKMMKIIEYMYPAVQQNLNLNVDIAADNVVERLKNWKAEQVVAIE